MTTATHPAPVRQEVGPAALWFGLFGGPAAWTIQELVAYAIAAHACYPSMEPKLSVAMPWVTAIDLVLSLVMLVVTALATLASFRSWARTRDTHEINPHHTLDHGEGRIRFMALGGIILSLLFGFNIVMNGIVLLLQPACS